MDDEAAVILLAVGNYGGFVRPDGRHDEQNQCEADSGRSVHQ
jgi:hypothetical protein